METKIAMLIAVAGFVAVSVLMHFERRKLAGLALGLVVALIVPAVCLPVLFKLRRDLGICRHMAADDIRRTIQGGSAAFGLLFGLGLAFRKAGPGARKRQWDEPTRAENPEKPLGRILKGEPSEKGTFLGTANWAKVFVTDKEREGHMQIVGPTRSGKSQLLFALSGQDMKRGMPVFFMEAKGDSSDFDQFFKLAGLAGRAADVRYFNPQDSRSMSFNPIRRLPGQDSTAIANQLARAIGREPTSSGEGQDYYRSLDYARMLNMIEVFCATGLEFTFKDCLAYFSSDKSRRKAFDLCKNLRKVDAANEDFKKGTDTTALTSAIRPWTTGELGRLLNDYSPEIRLEEVFEKDQLAYFAVPIGHLQVLANPLGRMIISGLLSVAAARQKTHPKPKPATVILDEFSEFATPVFSSFIATVGSARFWTVLSHQDLGQLKRIEGMSAEAFQSLVFANTSGFKVCFRTPAPEDAAFWSATVGTYTTYKDTEQFRRGALGTMRTGEISRREVDEYKVHPNTLKGLMPGTALMYSAGRAECIAKTASVAGLLKTVELPILEGGPYQKGIGLELESEAQGPGRFDNEGRLR